MRRAAKIDANHVEIVQALRMAGASVQSIATIGKGCPDLLVGYDSQNFVFEIKDSKNFPSAKRLNEDEWDWHDKWKGQVNVVESAEQALEIIRR